MPSACTEAARERTRVRRARQRLLKLWIGLATVGALLPATASAHKLDPPADSASTQAVATATVPRHVGSGNTGSVIASATWGVSNGKSFVRVTKGIAVGEYRLEAEKTGGPSVPGQNALCTEDISDVTRHGGFYWSTSQICSGFFGAQDMSTQMWRSSWSGPRGYGGWAWYPPKRLASQSYISENWTIACNNGKGYYDYYPVMQGYASNIGSGPVIRSANQFNHQDCGPTPP